MRLIDTKTNDVKVAKIYRDAENQEFVVKFFISNVHQINADYFTDDKSDAIGTANVFVDEKK